jgi:hypothetical protein
MTRPRSCSICMSNASDSSARVLMSCSFFSGCHLFIPIFDVTYDSFDELKERSPWTFDAILAVAGKIKSGNNPPAPSFYKALEESQGIARSSLFGPVVRKEAVQGRLSIVNLVRDVDGVTLKGCYSWPHGAQMAGCQVVMHYAWLLIWACIARWKSLQIAVERPSARKSSATLSSLRVFGCAFTGLIISEFRFSLIQYVLIILHYAE